MKAGNACSSLQVGLVQVHPLPGSGQHDGGCQGGSPSRQRRRQRREAERPAKATNEELSEAEGTTLDAGMKDIVAGEDNKVLKKDDTEEGENYVVNELKIDAHEKC